MPSLDFATQTYSRPGYGVPQMRLENMYAEITPSGPGKTARYPRPVLQDAYTIGSGPIRGMFYASGVVGGYKYAVSGTDLYRDGTYIGPVAFGERARFAGSAEQLGVVIGGKLYCYDGTTLSEVSYFNAQAYATFTLSSNPGNNETVSIGVKTYRFRTVLSTANDILIGANVDATIANLISAITTGGTGNADEGIKYGTGTIASTQVTAEGGDTGKMVAIAIAYGIAGTSIAVSDTAANGSWDSATLTNLDPLPYFTGINYGGGRFYLTVQGSDTYYWSAVSDLTQIDALSFATAESSPDTNVEICTLADEQWFFGEATVEPWHQTGLADAPLQRSQGRRFEKGASAQATIISCDNTLFFVTNDKLVCRSGQVPLRVSTHAIEDAIQRCADITTATAYSVPYNGHNFYVLNLPGVGTYAFDVANSQWARWTTYGQDNFIPAYAVTVNGATYLGSGSDGRVYTFSDVTQKDAGQPVTFLASAFLPLPLGNLINLSLMLQCTRGLGSVETVESPVVQMRYSDDAGRTWSTWKSASLGKVGQYSFKAIWRRLGQINSPGRVYEFRCTDNVPVVFEYITYNQGQP